MFHIRVGIAMIFVISARNFTIISDWNIEQLKRTGMPVTIFSGKTAQTEKIVPFYTVCWRLNEQYFNTAIDSSQLPTKSTSWHVLFKFNLFSLFVTAVVFAILCEILCKIYFKLGTRTVELKKIYIYIIFISEHSV